MAEIAAAKAFRQAHGFAVWVPHDVQGRLIVEPGGFDDEVAGGPSPHRIAKPARLRIRGGLAAIGEDLTKYRSVLVQDHRESGGLDNFKWDRNQIFTGQGW